MNKISKKVTVGIGRNIAFQKFVSEFNEWWPKEYTWSQEDLEEIKTDGKKNGLCTEIGPFGFRIDWGRVTEFLENEMLRLKWQISPNREPIPNPNNASDIKITFTENKDTTTLEFEHYNFEKHGDGGEDYQIMMNGEYGWDFILSRFQEY